MTKAINDFNDINIIDHLNKFKIINDNDNDGVENSNDKRWMARQKNVDAIANNLVRIYKAPDSRQFFLKCAWHLSEAFIMKTVEASTKPQIHSSLKYFVKSCHRELIKNN